MSAYRVGVALNLVAYVDADSPEAAKAAIEEALIDKVIYIRDAKGLNVEHDTDLLQKPEVGVSRFSGVATFGGVLSDPDLIRP